MKKRLILLALSGLVLNLNCTDDTISLLKDLISSTNSNPNPQPYTDTASPVSVEKDLWAYYPLNGNALNKTGVSGRDCEVIGAVSCVDRFGNVNGAYNFVYTDDVIKRKGLSGFPEGNCSKTVSGWFKSNSITYIQCMFGIGKPGSKNNFQICQGPADGENEFRINGWGDQNDWRTGVVAAPYFDGDWHHVVVTYDGSRTIFYLDGEKKSQTERFRYLTDPKNSSVIMGIEIDEEEWNLQGAVDDVRIYTRAINENEVKALYSENGWGETGLWAHYPLNGNGLNVSGESGRDCQIQGALACVDRFGKEGMAISFNRAKDIVSSGPLTGFPYGNCAKSVSGWFQADSAQYYYQCLFGIGKPGSQYNFQICEGPSNAGDDYEFRINGWGDQYDWRTGVKAAPYFNRTWHHAAVSYDGFKTVFYLDGKRMAQTESYSYYTDPNSSSVIMGVEIDTLGWNLKGAIDDVRIYARALTDSDVNKIFNSRD